jgi:hypothetical protein
MKVNADLDFASHGGTAKGLPAPGGVLEASRKQEMDDHKAETIMISGSTRIHGLGVDLTAETFFGLSGRTINLPASWGVNFYAVFVLPIADPDGYLGEVWVQKGASSFIIYNSGSAAGGFYALAIKFADAP